MPDLALSRNSSPGDLPSLLQTCRRQHQLWQTTITQHEQEIDELLAQLGNSTEHSTDEMNRSLAVYYCRELTCLKRLFHRLRLDMVCENTTCLVAKKRPCTRPRLGLYATTTINETLHNLINELNRLQTGLHPAL